MKKSLLTVLAIMLALTGSIAMAQTFNYPVKGKQGFALTQKTRDGLHISYNLGQMSLSQLNYRGEEMSEITISAIALPNNAGCPNLPTESRMIAIPQGATATLNVVHFDKEVIHNINIAPALRIQAESEEPDMNYVKDMTVYSKNAYYPAEPFVMGSSYIRGVESVTVAITPFQYNPVTKDLIVYTNVELAITFEGGNGHFGEDRLRSPYWDPILAAELMNYDQLPVIDYEARMQEWLRDDKDGAEYLIITPNNDAWAEYANQLKEYRTRQGIITEVYRLDEMPATSTAQMKSWFHNAYNTWEIAPVAICLLGDHGNNMGQYIPAETVSHPSNGSCITDNRYADVVGNDNLPDMVFSRLIAETPAQLPVFVGKQLEYEYTNPNMDPAFYNRPITALGWQTERWFQICSEVFGGYMRNHGYDTNRINCIYQGQPGNIWSSNQNTSMVVNYFGPNGVGYIPQTPSELGDWNNGTPELVVQAVNEGSFWLQHRDHGLETGWGEPAVRNSHVYQMNNVGKMPFVMSINCLTGKFNYNQDCFAEAWMRRTYNGENAGAVGVLCPTETSYSFVNDAYVWGVYDLFDGDFMPTYGPYAANTGNWMPAFGNVAGKYFLAQSNWPYNTDSKDITYTMFTAHCDAFLRVYTQVPQEMEVVHPEVVIAGLGEVTITAPEGCMISLVKEDLEGGWEILAVAEATGDPQTIEFVPQVPPTEINLVVTGQNYLRYEAVMGVIPADGPYVVFDSKIIHDQNNNQQLDFGETIDLDITLKNVGSEAMQAFEAVLETESEYITITNGTAQFENLDPNATQTVANAFSFAVANNVPDNTSNRFTITVTNGDDVYVSNLAMKAYAPALDLGSMSITEVNGNGNGRLDAGETAKLSFPIENKGHADAATTMAELQMLSPYIIVEEGTVFFDNVNAGATQTAVYNISIDENAPIGYICPIAINVTSGQYNAVKDYVAKVGLIVEDFELNEFGEEWLNDAGRPWTFVSDNPYEGNYCVKSGGSGISNVTSNLILSHEAGSNDSISFYYKVSSESGYDKLHFYIDNQEMGTWSGNIGWTKAIYPVTAGRHTYKWAYTKDGSVNNGSDCGWIDYIGLPAERVMAGTAGHDVTVCEGNDAQIVGYAIHYDNLTWTTSGDGTFDDATIATPIYTPGTQDIANHQATLTLTIIGEDETITDDMTVIIVEKAVITPALVGETHCAVNEPQTIAVDITGDYVSFQWLTSGDGEFEDATALETTYTPGLQDIANGVSLTAFAVTPGCGSVTYDYPFEMNPMPEMTLATESITVCQGENAVMNFTLDGYTPNGIPTSPDFTVFINGERYELTQNTTSIDFGVLEVGEHVYNITSIANRPGCNVVFDEGEFTFTVKVNAAPTMTISEVPESLCEGESVIIEFNFSGTAPFSVEATGMDNFMTEGNDYTMTLTPTSDVNVTFTKVTDANGCETTFEQAVNIVVNPMVAQPEISGDADLDVRLTPTTTYTIANDVMVGFSIEPEGAGTLVPANDGKTVVVTWSETYKGEVVMTAVPTVAECNNGNGTLNITVKNSTDVNEYGVKANLYPNPTNGNVTIEAEGMQRLTVVNELGQVVYDAEVSSDTETLNMSPFGAGVYMIRIYTENGMGIKRVSVIR
ncbi:MAG: T9SS type A sorting domain-containing protein [Bacteroidales bacterium]|nr:T9SS type A sorting domain-containing protein [Bacteroidales bacterium]